MEGEKSNVINLPKIPKIPESSKRFDIPGIADKDMEERGVPREDVMKIAEEAERISEDLMRNPERKPDRRGLEVIK